MAALLLCLLVLTLVLTPVLGVEEIEIEPNTIHVSKDIKVSELKKHGIKPFDVKEAAIRAATSPTKKIESLQRSVVTGHANYFDDIMVLALLLIATIAFFKGKFKVKILDIGYISLLRLIFKRSTPLHYWLTPKVFVEVFRTYQWLLY